MHELVRRPPTAAVEQLARWWTSATPQARFEAYERAIRENDPPLETLQLAALLAEAEETQEG